MQATRAVAKISQSDICQRPIRTCEMRRRLQGLLVWVVSLRFLQEFGHVSTRITIARGGAFGRVAAEL